MIKLGPVQIGSPVILAPMSGATDAPFRRQASRFGAPVVVSEMIAGAELARGRQDMVRRLAPDGETGPFVVQIAGREEQWMREGARIARDAGADVIDINMGCPSRQVTGGQSGAALMRDLELAQRLIAATLEGAQGPVTLKMRLGWDDNTLNAPQLARIAQAEGVGMITVHGRTRCQFYEGAADWAAVRRVVEQVDLPVIVNGDIEDVKSARRALELSGACGVMVGRAAMGRPWMLAEIAAALFGGAFKAPSVHDQIQSIIHQVGDSVLLYGDRLGVRVARKHVAAFVDHASWITPSDKDRKALRQELCRIPDASDLIEALDRLATRTPSQRSLATC